MKGKLSDSIRLTHALSSISDIESMMLNISEDEFYANTEKKLAVLKSLEIVSEALNAVSSETISLALRPIPLGQIKGFRNLIVHEYFRVDYTQVFVIVKNDLPELKRDLLQILSKIENRNT